MKILVFTSRDHFHAPIILRELALKRKDAEIAVLTTPKLGSRRSPPAQISRIVRKSGADYFFSMVILKICYILLSFIERFILFKPFNTRKYISISEVIARFNLKRYDMANINNPKSVALIKDFQPAIIITMFFNQILKEEILNTPLHGAINIHPAYLPAYRGFSPCFWVLANNEAETGVSIHYLTKGIDDGPVLWQDKISIKQSDSFFTLYRRSAIKEAEALPGILNKVKSGEKGVAQDESKATYFSVITPESVHSFRKNKRKFGWIF